MTEGDVTAAIDLIVAQGQGRAWTHELVLTPPGPAGRATRLDSSRPCSFGAARGTVAQES